MFCEFRNTCDAGYMIISYYYILGRATNINILQKKCIKEKCGVMRINAGIHYRCNVSIWSKQMTACTIHEPMYVSLERLL